MVCQRGYELADQVAVRAVDLQHVETGLPDAAGDLRVGVNDVFDILDIQHHAFGHGCRSAAHTKPWAWRTRKWPD